MIDLKKNEKSKAVFKNARRALAYDIYTFKSTPFIDETGEKQFDNDRSEMGDLVNGLKYNIDTTVNTTVIPKIVDLLERENEFIGLINDIDFIVPIPPSKKNRAIKPTIAVAEEVSKRFGKHIKKDFIQSSNTEQVKAIDPTERYDVVKKRLSLTLGVAFNKSSNILLFDDVLDTGSTIKAVMDKLISEGYTNISILTLTITKNSELK